MDLSTLLASFASAFNQDQRLLTPAWATAAWRPSNCCR